MQEEKHYRHECKYEITYADYYELRARLGCLMQRDAHVDADGKYRIHSLYFDNCDDIALREKNAVVVVREPVGIGVLTVINGVHRVVVVRENRAERV